MKKILYVEFSSGWGGSSEALYNLLKFSSITLRTIYYSHILKP